MIEPKSIKAFTKGLTVDEFRLLCQKHGIEIDERYVWD